VVIESRLGPGRFIVGRADTCDLALPDERISRMHCAFERQRDGTVLLLDQSRHGTYVWAKRVERAVLRHGDRVKVGSFELELALDRAAEPTAQPLSQAEHEQLLCADAQGIGVVRLALQVLAGPAAGRSESFMAGESEFRVLPVTDHKQDEADAFGAMIGASPAMRRVFGLLKRMAPHPVPVLLQGDSGRFRSTRVGRVVEA
jgi:hypothetical protein